MERPKLVLGWVILAPERGKWEKWGVGVGLVKKWSIGTTLDTRDGRIDSKQEQLLKGPIYNRIDAPIRKNFSLDLDVLLFLGISPGVDFVVILDHLDSFFLSHHAS